MDIEKLIEQLNGYFEGKDLKRFVALDAATALSTLQEENEKLRADLEQVKRERDEDGLYTMKVTGVIKKEEYEAALRREQDG